MVCTAVITDIVVVPQSNFDRRLPLFARRSSKISERRWRYLSSIFAVVELWVQFSLMKRTFNSLGNSRSIMITHGSRRCSDAIATFKNFKTTPTAKSSSGKMNHTILSAVVILYHTDMARERNKQLCLMWVLVAGLLCQNLVVPVSSIDLGEQKNYYPSPDPHAGTPPSGSHGTPPSHGSGGGTPPSHGTPSHGGGYHHTPSTPSTPSGGNCGTPPHEPSTPSTPPRTPSHGSPPSYGGGSPPTPVTVSPPTPIIDPGTPSTPPSYGGGSPPTYGGGSPPTPVTVSPPTPIIDPGTPSTPPSYGGGSPPTYGGGSPPTPVTVSPPTPIIDPGTPSTPPSYGGGSPPTYGGGSPPTPVIVSPPTPIIDPGTPSTPPSYGGGSPPTYGGGSPPTPIIDPGTPSIPTPPFFPAPTPPIGGTCDFWRSHPTLIWGLLGWWGTLGSAFGMTSAPGFGATMSLPQALSNTRSDGLGALYREGTASFLNSMVNHRFPFSTEQVRQSFVSALGSNSAAAAQAHLFKLANEGHIKPRT
ncbi:Protodermal factor 1 [Hibiscus syriacus]|uniref:Protodermal factor 1 n=1 Tax=Hibiscus syriacus TaxID=106335 RepID=A0A6A2YKB6_HIBSY|nr:Protodermal factor 1 [Hibiscus syriacus]